MQRAAEAGESRAAGEHEREEQRLVDAERTDHLAVLRGGADQPAEARLGENEVQADQHDRPGGDQEQVVAREAAIENFDRAAQARRPRSEQILVAPDPERRVVDDQQHREGGEQLEQLRRLIDAAKQQDLDQRADGRDQQRGEHDGAPEAEPAAHLGRDAVGNVDAQHVERAVGDVDDARDAEDQRQAGADEEQAGGGGKPVERLEQESVEGHQRLPRAPLRLSHRESPAREARRVRGYSQSIELAPHPNPLPEARARDHRISGCNHSGAGRSFLTSASGGITLEPSTYLKSDMVPLPSFSAILPT